MNRRTIVGICIVSCFLMVSIPLIPTVQSIEVDKEIESFIEEKIERLSKINEISLIQDRIIELVIIFILDIILITNPILFTLIVYVYWTLFLLNQTFPVPIEPYVIFLWTLINLPYLISISIFFLIYRPVIIFNELISNLKPIYSRW